MLGYGNTADIKEGTVLYHRIDGIKATVTKVDGDYFDVVYDKPLFGNNKDRYDFTAIGIQLFLNEEDVTSKFFEAGLQGKIIAEKNEKRLEQKLKEQETAYEKKIEKIRQRNRQERERAIKIELARKEEENRRLKEELQLRKQEGCKELTSFLEPMGFEGLCHYTDLLHLASIFDHHKVFSRKLAEEMDLIRFDALLRGIDPSTGEVLDADSFVNEDAFKAVLVTALHAIERKQMREKYKKPSSGARWTEDEEARLVEEYNNNLSISEIAEMHGRSTSSIQNRLIKLAQISIE